MLSPGHAHHVHIGAGGAQAQALPEARAPYCSAYVRIRTHPLYLVVSAHCT